MLIHVIHLHVLFYRSIESDLQKMDVQSGDLQKLHQQVTLIVQVNLFVDIFNIFCQNLSFVNNFGYIWKTGKIIPIHWDIFTVGMW